MNLIRCSLAFMLPFSEGKSVEGEGGEEEILRLKALKSMNAAASIVTEGGRSRR